jgi:hypothetical protein
MYEALAEFYEEKGYFVKSPARSYRYQVLFTFACEKDGEHESVYRELLTYDMYLRENVKSRPEFAKDLQEYKEVMRDFYRNEEEKRTDLPEYWEYDSKQLARMTHLEPFIHPVWSMPDKVDAKVIGEPVFLLFDYEKRDPLTTNAQAKIVLMVKQQAALKEMLSARRNYLAEARKKPEK